MSISKADPDRSEEVEEEEDDDAPESVTFEASRAVALEAFKAESARNKSKAKSSKKDKRKNRSELEETGEKSRLDLLREQAEDGLFDDDDGGQKEAEEPASNNVKKFDDEFDEDDMDEDESEEIIHGTTRFAVEKVTRHGTKHVPQSVLDLKKDLLYGKGSKIRREPSKQSVDRKLKVAATGKNVFCLP